jgi:hypothetical protein
MAGETVICTGRSRFVSLECVRIMTSQRRYFRGANQVKIVMQVMVLIHS